MDIPPAYIDTHVAQCMLELDYYMKALWHGAHFGRERRQKFTERYFFLVIILVFYNKCYPMTHPMTRCMYDVLYSTLYERTKVLNQHNNIDL